MRLAMHIGQGKTGTSYIQAAFAASEELFQRHDIVYPLSKDVREKALSGRVTSGNLQPSEFPDVIALTPVPRGKRLLLSNEGLFGLFSSGEAIPNILKRFRPKDVSVMLLVRDPLENAASSYLQAVQKGMFSGPFEDFLTRFTRPFHAARVVRNCRDAGINLFVRNYSAERKELLGVVEDWLGFQRDDLIRPRKSTINRSITVGEAEMQRRLNAVLERSEALRFADHLCERVDDVATSRPQASRRAVNRFQENLGIQTDEVHRLLGRKLYGDEDVEPYIQKDVPEFTFGPAQLDVLAELMVRQRSTPALQVEAGAEQGLVQRSERVSRPPRRDVFGL